MVSQLPSRYVRFGGVRADTVGVMAFLPLNELPALFPHVVSWISCLEKQAQESGRALTPIEFNLAQHIGVAHPEEVRILSVSGIPLPAHPRVKQLARRVGLLNADTAGLTAGYGLIVRRDCDKVRLITSRIRRGLHCASGLHRCPSNSRSQPQTNNGPAHIKPRNFAKS